MILCIHTPTKLQYLDTTTTVSDISDSLAITISMIIRLILLLKFIVLAKDIIEND